MTKKQSLNSFGTYPRFTFVIFDMKCMHPKTHISFMEFSLLSEWLCTAVDVVLSNDLCAYGLVFLLAVCSVL